MVCVRGWSHRKKRGLSEREDVLFLLQMSGRMSASGAQGLLGRSYTFHVCHKDSCVVNVLKLRLLC